MDTEKLIKDIKARFKHHESKLYLQEKYKSKLYFPDQGGMWHATPGFIGFLASAPKTTVIEDNYGNPIKVDTKKLHTEALRVYEAVMIEWHNEYKDLQNYR